MSAAEFGSIGAAYAQRAARAAQGLVLIGVQSADGARPKDERTGPDGQTVEPGEATLAEVAADHEYGTPDGRPPRRSFLQSTADERGRIWLRAYREYVRAASEGDAALAGSRLQLLGSVAVADVRRTIDERIAPDLSEMTKEQPGRGESAVPLKDTAQLYNSIRAAAVGTVGRTGVVG